MKIYQNDLDEALWAAIMSFNFNLIKPLASAGADVNRDFYHIKEPPLMYCAKRNMIKGLNELLDCKGIDISKTNNGESVFFKVIKFKEEIERQIGKKFEVKRNKELLPRINEVIDKLNKLG
jgi:hypothetical protein